jgi:ribosomal protein S18 acetylase RimI-like enzyme
MLEHVCSDAWPPVEQHHLGEWRLRWADGFTGRANSALAVGDPGIPLPQALTTVCAFAHSQGIPPAVQVVRGGTAPTSGWWELTAGTTAPTTAQRHVLASALTSGDVGYGRMEVDGVTAGAVRVAVVGEFAHIARLAVRPAYRRRGLAVALMGVAGWWARDRGATREVLQVSVSNAPALALYRELGFTEHHRYRYWVPPTAACENRQS